MVKVNRMKLCWLIPDDRDGSRDIPDRYQDLPEGESAPVFRSDNIDHSDSNTWYEEMYAGRSRSLELETDYLREEKKRISRFVQDKSMRGPCLEISCGVGLFAEIVPKFIGIEYALTPLLADGWGDFPRVCGDARYLPFIDSCMELVFSFNTLEHVTNVDWAFVEMDRVLQPGGYLFLRPAWHCTRYNTELIPILPYRQLNARQQVTKALLPILRSKLYKFVTRLPWRLWRRLTSSTNNKLSWKELTPYYGDLWQGGDSDAVASLDTHEAILFYQSRGYECLSHPGRLKQLLAGHDIVILRKPQPRLLYPAVAKGGKGEALLANS